MRHQLAAALTAVFIFARVPIGDGMQDVAETLRLAAIKAGCADPRVSMRWLGGDRGLEITVRCAVETPPPKEDDACPNC